MELNLKNAKTVLYELGFRPALTGTELLAHAAVLADGDPAITLTKAVYPEIAKMFNRSKASVERSIRTATEISVGYPDWPDRCIMVCNKYGAAFLKSQWAYTNRISVHSLVVGIGVIIKEAEECT